MKLVRIVGEYFAFRAPGDCGWQGTSVTCRAGASALTLPSRGDVELDYRLFLHALMRESQKHCASCKALSGSEQWDSDAPSTRDPWGKAPAH